MHTDFSLTHDDVDAIAAWTVIRAAREIARRLTELLEPLSLTPVEFGALVQLAAASGLTQADLARAVGIRPQSMTVVVSSLVSRDLIDRGAAQGRGKPSRIVLTEAGRAILVQAYPAVLASNVWFGKPDDVATMTERLRPMLVRLTSSSHHVP